ncbi:ABC transporter permease [Dyadobacter sp. CY261]|uniref:ABC transporter permease n=1 Tax=Dyadobacter sp. CY261 TaxID=2907203 RepID=UPI001F47AE2C|nr:ABC transporter permease [Dyadobacter sp. CY261]MCF0069602.1 ABC transporter permease [Dyadobacter sp. CY261]
MIKNYLRIAWRNLTKNTVFSAVNLIGLSLGMATAILIGLWLWDELSFNRYHQQYDRIARVMQHQTANGTTFTSTATPLPMRNALANEFGADFSHMALSSWTEDHILAYGGNQFTKKGNCVETDFPLMISLKMLRGTAKNLDDPTSVLLSESVAKALFGESEPISKVIKIDNKHHFKVTGVYEDLPYSTEFREISFLLPWKFFLEDTPWVKRSETNWGNNSFQLFVEIAPGTGFEKVSAKIENIKVRHAREEARSNPRVFLHPMSRWHLHSEWDNGVPVRGRIQYVWLFGIIGAFVLLLACINFMNLSTARSERRAKEVGVRKAVGSGRRQLISQFLLESVLMAIMAFILALALAQLLLPVFNEVADKKIVMPWQNGPGWAVALGFTMLTGMFAGSYPALFLSKFNPVKVLKGSFQTGKAAILPRQVLVVVQFTISITFIIGTLVVLRQIQHAKDRPTGFERSGLISIPLTTSELRDHYEVVRQELLQTRAVVALAESSSPVDEVWSSDASFSWPGKDPNQLGDFGTVGITHEYGKTVGWRFKEGRDFSRRFSTDSLGIVLNESAVKFMGIKNPVGLNIQWNGLQYTVIGVIGDVITGSPFTPVRPTIYLLKQDWADFIHIKLNRTINVRQALSALEPVFRKHNPGSPFEYKFADDEYDRKFRAEERIGQLASIFTTLAILISCLGLFGLVSFLGEQRRKEIGIRKVLGASVANVWGLLTRDFIALVAIASLLAVPVSYYTLSDWLQTYAYRTELSWWIFASGVAITLVITLLTVGFQAIKVALLNPIKSLGEA